ncbi:hypothetical protein OG285_04275 [Streptomyces sp. NBC_01471]|uniref:hypothetical protein n=1 Tax=Streptomyces sp. NBC_01471 TaxID=2903879 RepID=UPI003249E53E
MNDKSESQSTHGESRSCCCGAIPGSAELGDLIPVVDPSCEAQGHLGRHSSATDDVLSIRGRFELIHTPRRDTAADDVSDFGDSKLLGDQFLLDLKRRFEAESANEALERQAKPELINELLAGGTVAASFTAAASVAKAKIEATTQRRKDELGAGNERLRIESQERTATRQAVEQTKQARFQAQNQPSPPAAP